MDKPKNPLWKPKHTPTYFLIKFAILGVLFIGFALYAATQASYDKTPQRIQRDVADVTYINIHDDDDDDDHDECRYFTSHSKCVIKLTNIL